VENQPAAEPARNRRRECGLGFRDQKRGGVGARRGVERRRAEVQSVRAGEGLKSSRKRWNFPGRCGQGSVTARSLRPEPKTPDPRRLGEARGPGLRAEGPRRAALPALSELPAAPLRTAGCRRTCGAGTGGARPGVGVAALRLRSRQGEAGGPGSSEDTAPVLRNPRAAGTSSSRYRS